jgi:hypothetical protein
MKTAQTIYNQFDRFFNEICQDDDIRISLFLEVSDNPGLMINVNNHTIYDKLLTAGEHEISLSCNSEKAITLDISMYGKTAKDTTVQNNQIIHDKFIIIKGLKINNFDLVNDQELFYSKFLYLDEHGVSEPVKIGFWNNCTLRLEFVTPFTQWYVQNSHKNSHISDSLKYRNNSQTDEVFVDLTKNIQLLR